MRSVVLHRYIKATYKNSAASGLNRVKSIVDYMKRNIEDTPRLIFDDRRDDVYTREVMQSVQKQNDAVLAHVLVLSPGVNGANVKDYARSVMKELGSRKGMDLDWYAVRHSNTEHHHAHVVLMRKDKNGHRVSLKRQDYDVMRDAGDRYLERQKLLTREQERRKDRAAKEIQKGGFMRLLQEKADIARSQKWLSALDTRPSARRDERRKPAHLLSRGGY